MSQQRSDITDDDEIRIDVHGIKREPLICVSEVIRQQDRDIESLRAELADVTEQRDAWRRRAEESEPHLATGDKSQREIAANPGVQGLAQLGRNAIERVTELERELAAVTAERDRIESQRLFACGEVARICAERDQLRARLTAIDNAPIVAWASADLRSVFVDDELAANVRELIVRPAKDEI